MPPNAFPTELLDPLLNLADALLMHPQGPIMQIQALVPLAQSYDVLSGLLSVGFVPHLGANHRIEPIPVVIEILYTDPPPADEAALTNLFVLRLMQVVPEWIHLHQSGQPYHCGP